MNAARADGVSWSMTLARLAVARGALLALGLAACDGGGGAAPPLDAPGDDAAVDATADAVIDAPVDATPDAAVDATIDAAIDAGPSGPVTVRVARPRSPSPSLPLSGILVFASHPDGSLGTRGVTDANGEVTLSAQAGSTVTALLSDDGRARVLSSILGVEPGDVLTIDPEREGLGTAGPGVTYTWPQTPDADNSLSFDAVMINDGCWHRSVMTFAPDPPIPPLPTAGTLGLVPGCGADPRDVVVLHYDTDHLARYALLHGVPAAVAVRPIGGWSLPDTTFTARAVGLPAYVNSFGGVPSPVIHGHSMAPRLDTAAPTAGNATLTTPWVSAFGEARVWYFAGSNLYGATSCFDDVPAGVHDVTFDGAELPTMVGTSSIAPATRRVTWDRSPGPDPDEIRVTLRYYGPHISPLVDWTLRAPGTADDVVLPELPPELAEATLLPSYSTYTSVAFFDLETVTDWPTMRALPFWAADLDAAQSNRWGRACQSWH